MTPKRPVPRRRRANRSVVGRLALDGARAATLADHVPGIHNDDRADDGRDDRGDVDAGRPIRIGQGSEQEATDDGTDDAGDQPAEDTVILVTGDDPARNEAGNGADHDPRNDAHSYLRAPSYCNAGYGLPHPEPTPLQIPYRQLERGLIRSASERVEAPDVRHAGHRV